MHSLAALAAPLLSMASYPIATYHYTLSSDIFVKQQHCKIPQKESKQPLGPTLSHLPGSRGHCGEQGTRGWEPLPSSAQWQRAKLHSGLIHWSQPAAQKLNEDLRICRGCCAGSQGHRCPSVMPGDRLQGHQLAWWSRGTEPPAWAPRAGTKQGLDIAPSFK